ncbi:zinc-binding dehydrogenase [Nonomuraea sp. NPDC050451]|uniref:zinc-binding dehydrogenase n=1 Tax=Nonomuraea sp. NPDC050451 TaxID=3364364 RepID=UPI0037A98345
MPFGEWGRTRCRSPRRPGRRSRACAARRRRTSYGRSARPDVVDHAREDFAGRGSRYDVIVDTAGNRALRHLRRALTPRGTVVIVGGERGGRWPAGTDRRLRTVLPDPFARRRLRVVFMAPREADLRAVAELVGSGRVTPVVDRTYPLSEVPEAVRGLERGEVRGKAVVTV